MTMMMLTVSVCGGWLTLLCCVSQDEPAQLGHGYADARAVRHPTLL